MPVFTQCPSPTAPFLPLTFQINTQLASDWPLGKSPPPRFPSQSSTRICFLLISCSRSNSDYIRHCFETALNTAGATASLKITNTTSLRTANKTTLKQTRKYYELIKTHLHFYSFTKPQTHLNSSTATISHQLHRELLKQFTSWFSSKIQY